MPPATSRATYGLVAAAVGIYALLMAGATAAVADAAAACSTWPACRGPLTLAEPAVLVAWGHRLAALLVGAVTLGAAALAWPGASRRVKAALAGALLLYPVQVGLGAATAVGGASPVRSGLHLGAGMGIFAALLLALAWSLESDEAGIEAPRERPAPGNASSPPSGPTTAVGRAKRTLLAYARLTKPRLMWLLCLVAAAAMGLAAGGSLRVHTVVATLTGGVLAIGASGTFNHVLERDVDRRMRRTADRPLATDEVGVRNAVAFGVALAAGAVLAFLSINPLAAALGLAAILYYSVVYTLLLKPNTVQNTVVGGLAGSFPALIGAAAATGTVGLPALGLAAVIFLWTPAHFYNLALAYKDDYARGGFPMMPVVRGEATTRKHILWYLGATLAASAALSAVADLGWLYALTAVGFGAAFLWAVVGLHRRPSRTAALRSFHASNAYLGAVLLAIVLDTLAL